MQTLLFLLAAQIALISARVLSDPRKIAFGLMISDRYVTPEAGGKLRVILTNTWNTPVTVTSISAKSYDINNGNLLSETESSSANYVIPAKSRIFVCRNTNVNTSPSNFPGKGKSFPVNTVWTATVNGQQFGDSYSNVQVERCDYCYYVSPDSIERNYRINGTAYYSSSALHSCI